MKYTSTLLSLAAVLCSLFFTALPGARAARIDINGPPGSGMFGSNVVVLPNGNFVVTDPGYDAPGPVADVGAVYLYHGDTLALISTLTGSAANDRVGIFGVTVLSNGNYVVRSPYWANGAATEVGAVTWCSGTAGVNGPVSAANSLVGSTVNDSVGYFGVTALSNGNYVVSSTYWNGRRGAITWGSGTTGVKGAVTAANSLVGSTAFDRVGNSGVTALGNGNYVVSSPYWANGAVNGAGAVTWGSGTAGVSGVVSAANSLVGSTTDDQVGFGNLFQTYSYYPGVTALANGSYVVVSPDWNNGAVVDAGAVTWGSGTTGVKGVISTANSLVGGTADDLIGFSAGFSSVTALANGNYVVRSPYWDNGATTDASAVTWGSGTTGAKGVVTAANSLVGSTEDDSLGSGGVTALANGNYVVGSPYWDNGAIINAGAVTWGSGTTGVKGVVSAANSLVETTADERLGSDSYGGVTALVNGNYVVAHTTWNGSSGAVTWGSGTTGLVGTISAANSLVGKPGDSVGSGYSGGSSLVIALSNGNYVVGSLYWNGSLGVQAGAVTWANGTTGATGLVSAANSLIGSRPNDFVGRGGVTALANGNYVVSSPLWDNNTTGIDAGAATWCSGNGVTGVISQANSLIGDRDDDQIGSGGATALVNGNYVVFSPTWSNSRGASTWGNGTNGSRGVVSAVNSLVSSSENDSRLTRVIALANGNYIVSRPYWGLLYGLGAVTWGSGTSGATGVVSAANSLVGSEDGDHVGSRMTAGGNFISDVTALNNGDYMVRSPFWDYGAGAVTLGDGTLFGIRGAITATNSALGSSSTPSGRSMNFTYDYYNARLLVEYPWGNRVSLLTNPLVIDIARISQGVRLRFSGLPGRTYTILRAPAVTGPWGTLNTQTVPPGNLNQLIEHIDTTPPPGQAFYRVRQP